MSFLNSQLILAGLYESALGIILINRQGQVVFWNRWTAKVSGIEPELAFHRTLPEIFPELTNSRLLIAVNNALDTGLPVILSQKLNIAPFPFHSAWSGGEEGDRIRQMVMIRAIQVPGEARHVLIQIQDVTQAVAREHHLRQQTVALRQMEKELRTSEEIAQKADQAKSKFLANISHEIRTPLNAIIGLTTLALHQDCNPRLHDYLQKIKSSSQILHGLIHDVLDFSKIEAGHLNLEVIEFDFMTILAKMVTIFAEPVAAKHVELVIHPEEVAPCQLMGDPLRLKQILINLINNAIKFTDKGVVVVRTRIEPVTPEVDDTKVGQPIRLEVSVRDTGIGMNAEQLSRLFRPFSQADDSTTRQYGGTGLGLAICRHLVEMMGGAIQVTSTLHQGSEFTFWVLLRRIPPTREARPHAKLLAGKGVVVADDCPQVREMLTGWLQAWGMRPLAVDSVSAVWEGYRQLFPPADLMVLDLHLAEASRLVLEPGLPPMARAGQPGLKWILQVEADERNILSPVGDIFHGVVAVLTKPILPEALRQALVKALGGGTQVQEVETILPTTALTDRSSLHGLRILLVEDNEINQLVMVDLLAREKITVVVANNGWEALQLLDRSPIDLVLMDLQMPVMDGYDATRMIRRHPTHGRVPVIAMTANVLQGDRERCLAVGMNDYIAKPIDTREVYRVLLQWAPGPSSRKSSASITTSAAAAQSATMVLPTRLPGLNPEEGVARLEGDVLLYLKLLRLFCEKSDDMVRNLQESWLSADLVAAQRAAHTLKGLAGNISAPRLQQTAQELESCLRHHESSQRVELLLTELIAAFEQVLESAAEILAVEDDKEDDQKFIAPLGQSITPAVSLADLGLSWRELLEMLKQNNLKAGDFLAQWQYAMEAHGLKEEYRHLAQAIERLDFAEAIGMLKAYERLLESRQ